jgi:Xaa-Pro aminopeptidase
MYSLDSEHFAQRRRDFIDAIGPDGVAVLTANPRRRRSKDTEFPYRPSSDILYLTGFREPETVLVIAPGHDAGEVAMFVRPRDEDAELWDGERPGPDGAEAEYGADVAYSTEELDDELPKFLEDRETLYYTLGRDEEFDQRITGWMHDLRHRRSQPPGAPRSLVDVRDVLHELRLRKRPEEIELMRRANEITAEAHIMAMRHCRPGMGEYELQALLEFQFRRHGAEFPAYPSIVGSGNNATCLHYTDNRDAISAQDVILVDAGCELGFYAGDITRSFPASGSFTDVQRDIYQAVLDAQKAAIADVEPGLPFDELQERTVRRLTESLVDLEILEGNVDDLIEEEEYKDYFPHRVGHWLGIDVHDAGPYYTDEGEWRDLEPGMVLTVEPGLYFPEADDSIPDAFRGTGVRIEDDILVTEDGYENFSTDCPKEPGEIEDLVGSSAKPVSELGLV